MTQKRSTYLMGAFIGLVIIAGLFGPWGISVILGALATACALTLA